MYYKPRQTTLDILVSANIFENTVLIFLILNAFHRGIIFLQNTENIFSKPSNLVALQRHKVGVVPDCLSLDFAWYQIVCKLVAFPSHLTRAGVKYVFVFANTNTNTNTAYLYLYLIKFQTVYLYLYLITRNLVYLTNTLSNTHF